MMWKLHSLIGKLAFAARAIPAGHLFLRSRSPRSADFTTASAWWIAMLRQTSPDGGTSPHLERHSSLCRPKHHTCAQLQALYERLWYIRVWHIPISAPTRLWLGTFTSVLATSYMYLDSHPCSPLPPACHSPVTAAWCIFVISSRSSVCLFSQADWSTLYLHLMGLLGLSLNNSFGCIWQTHKLLYNNGSTYSVHMYMYMYIKQYDWMLIQKGWELLM